MIKLYPDLALAAMRNKQDRPYRVWTLARALDPQGSGRVKVADLEAAIGEHGLRGLSSGTLRRLLARGCPVWWDRYKHDGGWWLRLRGLAGICLALGVEKLRRSPVLVPLPDVRTLRRFRAYCYAAMFPSKRMSNPVGRTILEGLTGASRRTLYSYEKLLGDKVGKQANTMPTRIPWDPRKDDPPPGCYIDYVNGSLRPLRRLPTSYCAALTRTARGMCRRVNRLLRGNSVRQKGTEAPADKRSFYQLPQSPKQRSKQTKTVLRRIRRAVEGDFFALETRKLSQSGARLWAGMQIVSGGAYAT